MQKLFLKRFVLTFQLSIMNSFTCQYLKTFSYLYIIESVLCTSITVWFSSVTKSDLRRPQRVDCWAKHWYNPPPSPRTVLIQSEKKGWQNHSGPLESSSVLTVHQLYTVWSTLQSSEHQNDQTQEQFQFASGNPSHEHLTLNVKHTALYNYLFTTDIHFFISNLHMSDLYRHNCLYCILCFWYFVHCLFVYYSLLPVSCPVAVILLHCRASVTIRNSLNV